MTHSAIAQDVPDGRIGPSPYFIGATLLGNPLLWVSVAAIAFNTRLAGVGYRMLESAPFLQNLFQSFFWWQKDMGVGAIALMLFGLVVARSLTWYSTARYELKRPFLYVRHGFLGRMRYGLFTNFTNTVALNLVIDCDISTNLIQSLFGTGTLRIRTSDGGVVVLEFIGQPQRVRNALLAATSLENARIIATA